MGLCRSIEELDPEMQEKVRCLLAACADHELSVLVIETYRTDDVQEAYHAQGREPLEQVNALRKKAGLWPISEDENRRIVTNVKTTGIHGQRLAADIVPTRNGKPDWSASKATWETLGFLGEACGLTWGGRWGQTPTKLGWDCPHFELRR